MNVLKAYPLVSRLLLLIVVPVTALVAYGYHVLIRTLPQTEGQVAAPGLSAPVSIRRDEHGVPTIQASSDRDAFFAVGYVHAQDRLWQLEVQRRTAYGRLSEVYGRGSLRQDVWFRTLGLRQAAESSWHALSAEARTSLTAYAAGINAWIDAKRDLPVEFQALGIKPESWTVYDSLACMKLFALNLGLNYQSEIRHMLAARMLDADKLHFFFPRDPPEGPISVDLDENAVTALQNLLGLQNDIEARMAIGGKYVGSNAWVVAGRHTAGGGPLLANDPHLQLQIPSLWYALRIHGSAINAVGMSIAGLPVVVLGKNEKIAWGATSLMADVQDLYLEQTDTTDPGKYRHGSGWKPFTERVETITVQADQPTFLHTPPHPVIVRVRSSVHGPIVSDVFDVLPKSVALRWVALDEDDTSYEAFFRLNYAGDWSAFQQALGALVAPALNMLYADGGGNIGYLAAGRIPIRRRGEGAMPSPGWDTEYEWRAYVPAMQMPRAFNPPNGYLISANDKIAGVRYEHFISNEWAPPARGSRIDQLLRKRLESGGKLTTEDMARMQTDVVDLEARELVRVMRLLKGRGERESKALAYLTSWNGEMDAESVAAAIFHAWTRHLRSALFSDDLDVGWHQGGENRYLDALIESIGADQLYAALTSDTINWCSDAVHRKKVTCEEILYRSLDQALRELAKLTGTDDVESWSWGKVHRSYYAHAPFSEVKVLRDLFDRQTPVGGSGNTINVATAGFENNEGYRQFHGPSFRHVIAVADQEAAYLYMNSTGQSGNVADEHYDDMIAPFRSGKYFAMTAADDRKGRELQLVPVAP